jgi:acyl carrier protein
MNQGYDPTRERVKEIINDILREKEGRNPVDDLSADMSLNRDLGLDSLDLAEMTVKIEDEYGVDVFEDDVVDEVREVLNKLET